MFCYSTYAFKKNIAYEKRGPKLITEPTERRSAVRFDDRCETLIPESILVPKLK
jgi:hypothetical protein